MATAAKATYGVLDNVVLAYAKLAEPTNKYESKDLVYEVDCIVEKAVAKSWTKQFPKQRAKEYDKEDFEKKFKMDAPFDGDEVFVIKMRKAASRDGEMFDEKYRPQVLLDRWSLRSTPGGSYSMECHSCQPASYPKNSIRD